MPFMTQMYRNLAGTGVKSHFFAQGAKKCSLPPVLCYNHFVTKKRRKSVEGAAK
jgi:hypothetical protein